MKITVVFLICFSTVLYSENSDSLHLRIFPELEKYKITTIEVVNPNFALAAAKEVLLQWDGENWTEFNPKIPLTSSSAISRIKALSTKNIWVFYQKHDFTYHNELLHFNGREWKSILTPQPYTILTASFIDSTRFFAGGAWASLFFFDGKRAVNIQTPPDIPKHQINRIMAFSNDDFIVLLQNNEYEKKDFLYRLRRRKWERISTPNENITELQFSSPDSGLIITNSGIIYEFRYGYFFPIDTLRSKGSIYPSVDICKDTIYYSNGHTIYRYHNFINDSISSIPSMEFNAEVTHIDGEEFFLTDKYQRLYYLGRSNIGMERKKERSAFYSHYIIYKGSSGHIGVSLYPNSQNTIDLCFINPVKPNWVYASQSDLPFTYHDVGTQRGLIGEHEKIIWDGGLYFADIDNDGDLDGILAALKGKSLLYENTGEDFFRDVTEQYNFNLMGRISLIYWCDLNLDGNMDFIAGDETGPLRFFIGNGFFRFTDITAMIIASDSLVSYMPSMADMDGDGDLDLLLYSQYNRIRYFENRGISASTQLPLFIDKSDSLPELTTKFDLFTQSVAFGDYDNDGDFDLFLANRVSPLKLFENTGGGVFRDVSAEKGLEQRLLSYGGNWGDLNQDGYPDLFVTTLGKNYIFWNRGAEHFEIDSLALPDNELAYSTGSVLADLDGDGDLDIIVANNEIGTSTIYENFLNRNNALTVSINLPAANRLGIGSMVYVYDAGHVGDPQSLYGIRQIHTHQGYCSSGLPAAHFGLPKDKQFDIQVKFPGGKETIVRNISIPATLTVSEPISLAAKANLPLRFVKSLFLHPGRRPVTYQFIAFLLIIIIFNFYLVTRSTWGKDQVLFFNGLILFMLAILYIFPTQSFHTILPVLIYGALVAFSFYGVEHYVKLKRSDANLHDLYDLLRQFSHGNAGMRQLDRLWFISNNMSDLKKGNDPETDKEIDYFRKYAVPLLDQINTLIIEANLPDSLIHRIKRASGLVKRKSYILSWTDKQSSPRVLKKYSKAINILRNELVSLRSTVEKSVSCLLLKTISDSLNKFPRFTDVSVNKPEFMEDIHVVITPSDFMQVLSNLFQNSLDAMKNHKTKKIRIFIEEAVNNQVRIKIQDAGPGIPSKIKNQIFKENFSTKQQSGVGLAHACKLLQRYGGDIHLINNYSLPGACFEIKLMVLNHDKRQ